MESIKLKCPIKGCSHSINGSISFFKKQEVLFALNNLDQPFQLSTIANDFLIHLRTAHTIEDVERTLFDYAIRLLEKELKTS